MTVRAGNTADIRRTCNVREVSYSSSSRCSRCSRCRMKSVCCILTLYALYSPEAACMPVMLCVYGDACIPCLVLLFCANNILQSTCQLVSLPQLVCLSPCLPVSSVRVGIHAGPRWPMLIHVDFWPGEALNRLHWDRYAAARRRCLQDACGMLPGCLHQQYTARTGTVH